MNILITGKTSFVGNYVGEYLTSKDEFKISYLSLRDGSWREHDFSQFDVIFHVAGIAHVSYKDKDQSRYNQVNHLLTQEVALKAKEAGIQQFIYMSSMIVFSESKEPITAKTLPHPKGPYGLSKLKAEVALKEIESNAFKVSIIRPAMIYGPGNKGNMPRLIKLIKHSHIFPKVKNFRSFLYIEHLAMAVHQLIKQSLSGTFHLAEKEPVTTYILAKHIGESLGKKIYLTRTFNFLIYSLIPFSKALNKLFGSFYYKSDLTEQVFNYRFINLKDSIRQTVKSQTHD